MNRVAPPRRSRRATARPRGGGAVRHGIGVVTGCFFVACGGKAIVDPGGEGGGASVSSSVTTAATTTGGGGCAAGLVACGGECVDPQRDPDHCGAGPGCSGGTVCGVGEVCEGGQCCPGCGEGCCAAGEFCFEGGCVESPINGSFETGDFTGWVTQDLADPSVPLAVVPEGTINPFDGKPTFPNGAYGVLHGFEGCGPGTLFVGQDVLIPPSASRLSFIYRAGGANFGTQPRQFEVHLEPPGGGAPVLVEPILALETDIITGDTGVTPIEIDVSALAGQPWFLRFVWTVPECFTGPGFAELDDVRFE